MVFGRFAHLLATRTRETKRFIEPPLTELPLIDSLCFAASLFEFDSRDDGTLDDALRTVGYTVYHDRFSTEDVAAGDEPYAGVGQYNGKYSGFGAYGVTLAQERDAITGLVEAVRETNPDTVAEIGTWQGGSLYIWTRALEATKYISIDIDFKCRQAEFFETFGPVTCLEGSSHDREMRDRLKSHCDGVDFLYIDGDHSYRGAKTDFELYEPLINDGGVIGLHDVQNPQTGVPQFWEELTAEYETEVFGSSIFANGLVYL